ncbi:MAG: GDSL-type esterase/lipase family protein [Intestinibacter sp.]
MKSITNLNNFLFIGDSYTERLKSTIKSKNNNAHVFALGGTTPGFWIDKISIMPDNVKAVVLLIGTNGILTPENIPDAKTLINNICEKYPGKQIFIQKIFPVGEYFYANKMDVIFRNNLAKKYNEEIEDFCKDKENIKIIDTTKGFIDEEGFLKFTSDSLHIDPEYNQKFYNNIFNAIKKFYRGN